MHTNKRVTNAQCKSYLEQRVKNMFKTGEKVDNFMKNAPTMKLANKKLEIKSLWQTCKKN